MLPRALGILLLLLASAWPVRAGDVERAARFAALEAEVSADEAASRTRAAAPDSDVAAEIRAFNAPRAENLPFLKEKLLRLASGPWSFLRGTAHLFYRHVASEPALVARFMTPATSRLVIHGDFHLQNCGTFEDARGKVRYDIQDFDDATRGSYALDVLRAATSLLVMADEADVSADDARAAVTELCEAYVESVEDAAAGRLDPDFSFKEDDAKGPVAEVLDRAKKVTRKSHLKKRCESRRIRRNDRFFDVSGDVVSTIARACKPAGNVLDVVRKKGNGCGSLGLDNFLVLVEGTSEDDDVILELKEQGPLSLPSYVRAITGVTPAAIARDPAERAVAAQGALQSNPDRWIRAVRFGGKSFLVREDSPSKDGLEATDIKSAKDLAQVARALARLAAKGHTRQGADVAGAILAATGAKAAFARGMLEAASAEALAVRADYRAYMKTPLARGDW